MWYIIGFAVLAIFFSPAIALLAAIAVGIFAIAGSMSE